MDSASVRLLVPFFHGETSGPGASSFLLRGWAVGLALVLCTCAVFLPSTQFGFLLWDDNINVTQNRYLLETPDWDFRGLGWIFETGYIAVWRPANWIAYVLVDWIFGTNAKAFHTLSVLLHSANVLLLFWLGRSILRRHEINDAAATVWPALLALVWALHPQRVEAVTWISALAYPQGLFFLLLAAHALLQGLARPAVKGGWWLILSSLLHAIAVLCHPVFLSAAAALLAVALASRYEGSRPGRQVVRWFFGLPRLLYFASLALPVLWAAFVTATASRSAQHYAVEAHPFDPGTSLIAIFRAFAKPAGLHDLCPYAPRLQPGDWNHPETMVGAALLAAMAVLAALLFRRNPFFAVLLLLFTAAAFPAYDPLSKPILLADRYTYFASLPWLIFAIMLIREAFRRCSRQWPAVGSSVLVKLAPVAFVLLLGIQSIAQQAHWSDTVQVVHRIFQVYPQTQHEAYLHVIEGWGRIEREELEAARNAFQEAVRLEPGNARAYAGLAFVHFASGAPAAARQALETALTIAPEDPSIANLARLLSPALETSTSAGERTGPDSSR